MHRPLEQIRENPTPNDARDLADSVEKLGLQIARLDAALVAAGAHGELKTAQDLARRLIETTPDFAADLARAISAELARK